MDISIEVVGARVPEHIETYRESAPFYLVEKEAIESLPAAFRAGEYGPRDVEWVVRWYFRRRVDAIDHERRRAVEDTVADMDRAAMRDAMWEAVDSLREDTDHSDGNGDGDGISNGDGDGISDENPNTDAAPSHHEALDALTRLPGVDLAVGSALLWFLAPERFFVVGDREWEVVAALTDLDDAYPESMTVDAYDRYLGAVRGLAAELDVDHWELYLVVQRVHAEAFGET